MANGPSLNQNKAPRWDILGNHANLDGKGPLVLNLQPYLAIADELSKTAILGKLISPKSVTLISLRGVLNRIWRVEPSWTIEELRQGIFALHFHFEKDCQKILLSRP
ncbi:hypothetical protein L484_010718 [Morus notabilis]|uniref:Uncharacterized protein n=1 Tax=Morus notabilis TaxID=981085 RepID=W9RIF8_9ROSA|nr:hypothetical protein L484_010718 [Morus notabilis]